MTSETNIAWSAGLFEGEGTVIYGDSHKGPLKAKISSTDLDVLELLVERCGIGYVYGPNAPRGFGKKPFYTWVANGEAAFQFFQMIRPWLGSRRLARIDEKIALWESRPNRNSTLETRDQIREERAAGAKLATLADKYGFSVSYISHMCTGRVN